tara:strand:- start:56 stop:427 length:372 start_codon:yes stop_codon:yes gene_type:complete
MSLTDREKKIIKSKLDEYKKIIYDTGASRKKVVEVIQSTLGKTPLKTAYENVESGKDKFKGGVPGAADKFFEKQMKKADNELKDLKREGGGFKYDKKTDDFKRKGPRGDRTKRYSNSVRIIED